MQDYSIPATSGGNATQSATIVGSWTSTMNQQHTINVTLPPGADESGIGPQVYAVIDSFM